MESFLSVGCFIGRLFFLKKTKKWMLAGASAATAAAISIAIFSGGGAVEVEAAEVGRRDMELTLEISGELEPSDIRAVVSEYGGRISTVLKENGDSVRAGESIAVMEAAGTEAFAAASAGISYEDAYKTAIAAAQASGCELYSYNASFENRALETSAEGGDSKSITTAVSGKLLSVDAVEGGYISAGAPIATVGNTDRCIVRARLNEDDIGLVSVGMPVLCSIEGGESFDGRIESVGSTAAFYDTLNKQVDIVIEPDEAVSDIIGRSVRVSLVTDSEQDALCIPCDCVTDKDEVFVIAEDGILEKRAVITGLTDGVTCTVISGLSEDERIVLLPSAALTDGTEVKVKQ